MDCPRNPTHSPFYSWKDGSGNQVAHVGTDQGVPFYNDAYKDRAVINATNGAITIRNLTLNDNVTYICMYEGGESNAVHLEIDRKYVFGCYKVLFLNKVYL